ncbi:MAG: hypothetical protein FWF29_08700 [Treponema sp.]|nr:hypothetical protein [Treponema sp.]
MEKELLEKILAVLQAQDARIKALEAQAETDFDTMSNLVDIIYEDKDSQWYRDFSDKYRSKFEPYLKVMDQLEGGDSLRVIYDKTKDIGGAEGYDEGAYVDSVLASVVEMIDSLKGAVAPEAKEALDDAKEAVVQAAQADKEPELFEETEINDSAPDEWSAKDLEKEKLEGRRLYE